MTRSTLTLSGVLSSAALLTGCMSAAVFDYVGDQSVRAAAEPLPIVIVMNDLTIPNTRSEILAPNQTPSQRLGDTRFDSTETRLHELLRQSAVSTDVRMARDLSSEGVAGPGFVVQYGIQSYASSSSIDAGGFFAGVVGTILTGGLGFPLIGLATVRHEHNFQVEVRLYHLSDSRLVSQSAPRTGERISQFDTAGAEVVYRNTLQLQVRSGHCQNCTPSGADAERFRREEGAQMARVIYDATMPALVEAMRGARRVSRRSASAPTRRRAARPQTARGELATPSSRLASPSSAVASPDVASPDDEAVVRARLDARSRHILMCVESDAAALIVAWDGHRPAQVSVRGVSDAAVLACVRAAVGDLDTPSTPGRVLHVIGAAP